LFKSEANADSIALEAELKKRNIDVSVRQGNIRLSFHMFNTSEQVDELIKALDSHLIINSLYF
jgi:selenocysteine lyase/cysteine desulfurase